ncbi:MAG TPA: amino acid permease [Thermoflexia bacterium]|nr:amino acid permease [Thermoflexia bacterium]
MNHREEVKVTLTRDLGLFDITMIGVGGMIGAGIFVLTGIAAGEAGPALMLAFLLNGLITLFTAASYAELGSAFPGAGGGYPWVREGLSPFFGFLVGWMDWFAHSVACSLYALGFGSFSARLLRMAQVPFFGLPEEQASVVLAVVAAALFTYINYRGASETGKVGNIVTMAKVLILGVLAVFGLRALFLRPDWTSEFVPFFPNGFHGVLIAMGLTSIAFQGYEIIAQSGEEVVDPDRNIPRAMFGAIGIVVAIYLLIAFVLLGAVEPPDGSPSWQFLGLYQEQAVVEAAEKLMPYGSLLLLLGGLMSTLSALNATIYSSSRVSFAMGRNRDLPGFFGQVHPVRHTPHWAIFFSGGLVILMAVLLPIRDVASSASIMFLLVFMMVNATVIVLRKKRPDVRRPFRVPLLPLFPLLGIFSQIFLSTYLFNLSPIAWYASLAWIGLGVLFYFTYARRMEALPEPVRIIHEEIVAVTQYSVLIPVSDVNTARLLGILGAAIAKDRGGELFALHVVRVPAQLGISDGRFFLKQGKPILEAVIEEAKRYDVPVHTMIRLGRHPATAIIDTAYERGTDLMILAWPGYTTHPSAAFGSVIDLVAKNPPCDLAVVRFRRREPPRRILIPTAGGPHAALAIDLAIAQARQYREESGEESIITLFYVLPEDATPTQEARVCRILEEQSRHYDYPLVCKVARASSVVEGILQEAEDHNLVMVGASAERLFEQRLFGSIPEKVARECPKTVIMIKRYWPLKSRLGRLLAWWQGEG